MTENKADPLREALEAARSEIVVAIAFLSRDTGTNRSVDTVRGIIDRLARADAAASAALAAQPAAPLGGREAIARMIRKALVENWRDDYDGRQWDEDVLLTGCRKVCGGMGYQKPDEAAQRLALDAADAILAAIPQERGAVADIVAERDRQISQEGWSREHDDAHIEREMAIAAACYASAPSMTRIEREWVKPDMPKEWPWKHSWWKPGTMRKNLVKAGALIVAEIERLDRAALQKDNP